MSTERLKQALKAENEWLRDHGNDHYAATRRAIVCAAAEIGRRMIEENKDE